MISNFQILNKKSKSHGRELDFLKKRENCKVDTF